VQAIDLSQSLAPSAAPAIGLVTVDRKELLAALAFVGKVAERKSTMPCLSWVRLCAHGGALTCETTDLYPVDAQFPPYGQVIPQGDGETRLTFDRATLARALKSAAAVASKHTGGVVLDAMGPTVMLSATRDGATATLPLPCVDRQGATMAIGFNAGYWRDFLASIPKAGPSEITVKFGGELAPMVSMVDVSPEARLTWVCMPMRR